MSDKDLHNWFATWFNTEYYHLLYADRDETEATLFITNLSKVIHHLLGANDTLSVLDLACGKGRHAREFQALGFDAMGIDLSESSIREARRMSPSEMVFEVQDMRSFSLARKFDIIVNLFTSFGYFTDPNDNLKVLECVQQHLKDGGIFILDFLNLSWVESNLVPVESKKMGGIDFKLKREITQGMIIKDICFQSEGSQFHFQERVQALAFDDIESMLTRCGFEILSTFGDYELNSYSQNSPRAIFMARK